MVIFNNNMDILKLLMVDLKCMDMYVLYVLHIDIEMAHRSLFLFGKSHILREQQIYSPE